MREAEVKNVLLVQAFEEADPQGSILPQEVRDAALDEATRSVSSSDDRDREALVLRRASVLIEHLRARVPVVGRVLRSRGTAGWLGPGLVVAALLVGLFLDQLGGRRTINVLSFPFLAVVLWNLGVYAWLLWPRARRVIPARIPWTFPESARLPRPGVGDDARYLISALGRYAQRWEVVGGRLTRARWSRLFHLAAAAVAAGMVLGMYLRGLALEYQASWESTFLGAESARRFLLVFLAPASWLTGLELPDLASEDWGIPETRTWIHLYAVTAIIYVVTPRVALALGRSRRVRQLSTDLELPWEEDYFRRILAPSGGENQTVRVIPYSYRPSPRRLERLKSILHDLYGSRAAVELASPVEYGAEAEEIAPREGEEPADRSWCLALLFSLSQSPEAEVHGDLVEGLKARTGEKGHILVLVDGAPLRERLDPDGEDRFAERRRNWDRVLRTAGVTGCHVDLEAPLPPDLLQRLGHCRWPERTPA